MSTKVKRELLKSKPASLPVRGFSHLALISKREFAALLNVNTWSVDRWRKTDPDFPSPIWISKSTPRWRRVDVETWLATRQRGGVSPEWQQSRSKGPTDAA